MPTRASILLAACLLLLLHAMTCAPASNAAEVVQIIRMNRTNGQNLHVPEVTLTRPTNPVTSVLFLGAFEGGAGKDKNPLCAIDSRKNEIHIKSPGRLLENSKPRVITRNNADAFLDSITWGRQQVTYIGSVKK